MSTLQRAIEIATLAHQGQVDKSGKEYIGHPLRVMEMGKTEDERIVGVLHDVVEDTGWTFEKLAEEECHQCHQKVHCRTDEHHLPRDRDVFGGVVCLGECRDEDDRIIYLNVGETLNLKEINFEVGEGYYNGEAISFKKKPAGLTIVDGVSITPTKAVERRMIAIYVIIANPTFFIKTTKKDNKAGRSLFRDFFASFNLHSSI